jgi:tRNA pseudouridine38-40 synthase
MPRYRFTVEYDGTAFVGWQRQTNGASVQAALEDAIFAFCGERVTIIGAGRTDSGVHALGQVCHADLAKDHPPRTVANAVNFHLKPAPVAVTDVSVAADDFHARFSATSRHYLYRILNRAAAPTVDRDRVWAVVPRLDAGAMHRAAQSFTGRHDFTTFRDAQCQALSPVKTLDAFEVLRVGDEIRCSVSARSFLHHQVRSMVGTLKLIGEGKWPETAVADALAARDRSRCGPTAPAAGLYLVRVGYDARPAAAAED